MSRSRSPVEDRSQAWRLLREATVALVVLGAISGCGGSSSDEEPTSTPADDASVTDRAETDDSSAGSGDDNASGNYARVTIGSDTFEMPPDGLNGCNSLDNLIFGSFAVAADGSAAQAGSPDAATQINFGVPVTNWEEEGLQAPIVNLDLLDEGTRWFASVDRGLGSVDSWQLADGMATGQATFEAEEVGSGAVIATETGSFEIVCR
ncbi:MAG: hypothetical protein OES24_01810 [Acidimicrobiia bacterium]|nr:hypothetical protein [Acidimicrobiia bacterium]